MGNYKFRLSDMIPNAWFYKLKDMNRFRKNQLKTKQGGCGGIKDSNKHAPAAAAAASSSSTTSSSFSSSSKSNNNPHMSVDQRKSYHFTRDFNDFQPNNQPPKSTRIRRITNPVLNRVPDSLSPSESDRALTPDTNTLDLMLCKCRVQNDIVIELLDDKNNNRLPPIITKKNPIKQRGLAANSKSPGLKLRTNTPRIGNRKINAGRKSISSKTNSHSHSHSHSHSSFAVVKTSKDPRRDFRESMVEMIVENKISKSKDLEELLASYLSLNSDEYHDLIINVFKQIWFDFVHVLPN